MNTTIKITSEILDEIEMHCEHQLAGISRTDYDQKHLYNSASEFAREHFGETVVADDNLQYVLDEISFDKAND